MYFTTTCMRTLSNGYILNITNTQVIFYLAKKIIGDKICVF